MEVTSNDPSINASSELTLRVQTLNPLQINSNIEFTIPADFSVGTITAIGTLGSAMYPSPTWVFDAATRKLSVDSFNQAYLGSREFIYIVVKSVVNPAQTNPTASFTFAIFDPLKNPVEQALSGISFTATAGGFASISVSVDLKVINEQSAAYTFTMRPQDTFTSAAIIKILLPTQIYVDRESRVSEAPAGGIVDITTAKTEVNFNRIIYIRDAFPNGMPSLQTFSFTLSDFRNPSTTQTTDSFSVKIFYTEDTNEVSLYTGNELTFTAEPSTALTMAVTLKEQKTGEMQSGMVFEGSMDFDSPIDKQAYLRIQIPA